MTFPNEVTLSVLHFACRRLNALGLPGGRLLAGIADAYVLPKSGVVVVHGPAGTRFRVDLPADGVVESTLIREGVYEAGTLHILKRWLRPGDVVVDVGANIGAVSLPAARIVEPSGSVHSFEPHPDTVELLLRNVRLSAAQNVHVHARALGRESGAAVLRSRPAVGRGGESLVLGDTAGQTVDVATLDDLVREGVVPHPTLLKVDVEGAELDVLGGAEAVLSSRVPPFVIVECSRQRGDDIAGAMYRYLSDLGYSAFRLSAGKGRVSALLPVHGASDLPQHDNLFLAPKGRSRVG